LEFASNVTQLREVQPLKQWRERLSSDLGMQIDASDEQSENTPGSIWFSWISGSKVTVRSELQSEKDHDPMCLTEAGMQIAFSAEHFENTKHSIKVSLEFDSKITVLR
jgi:hypothetical protein